MSSKKEVQATTTDGIGGRKTPAFSTVSVQDAADESSKEIGSGHRRQSGGRFFNPSSNSLLMQGTILLLGIGLAILGWLGLNDYLFDHFVSVYGVNRFPYCFAVHLPATLGHLPRARLQEFAPLVELLRWVFFALLFGGSRMAVYNLVELVPRLVSLAISLPESVKVELVHFHRLSRRFSTAVALVILWLVSADTLSTFNDEPTALLDRSYDFIIKSMFTFFTLVSVLMYLRKLLVQRIAISYHAYHYADRVKLNNARVGVLNTLKKYVLECVPYDPQLFEGLKLNDTLAIFSNLKDTGSQGTKESDAAYVALIAEIDAGAKDLSKAIVKALRPADRNKDVTVTSEDFLAVFQEGAAKEAFDLLDADGNGDLTVRELRSAIVEAFQERLAILRGVSENEGILDQLDTVFAAINTVANVNFFMSIFGVDFAAMASLLSLGAGCLWLIWPLVSSIFVSVLFVFINHPYDAGDRVEFDDMKLTVVEISLQTTTFRLDTGEIMYCTNSSLIEKKIKNLRRSGNQTELIKLEVPNTAESMEKMNQLKEKLRAYFASAPRDFVVPDKNSAFFSYSVKDFKNLSVQIDVEYRGNFQDHELRTVRKNKFAAFFAQTAKSLSLVE